MLRKILFMIVILFSVLVLATACTTGEEAYWEEDEQEIYGSDEEESVASEEDELTGAEDLPDGSNPTCLATMAGMLDFDSYDEDDYEDFEGSDLEFDEEIILVTYQVDGDEIGDPLFAANIPDELLPYQEDTERHQELWEFASAIMPAEQRTMLGEFIIFSDGAYNVLGAVDDADVAPLWTLEIDIVDSADLAGLSTTLIHEFGHMVTLNDEQVGDGSANCSTYVSDDGCTAPDSYLNAFYDRFWSEIYEDWSEITNDGDEDLIEDFYNEYPDQFVSDYAATSPEEDIAESWTYFIFAPRPAGDGIADEKVLFFYEYPELVEVRQQIINGLCPYIDG